EVPHNGGNTAISASLNGTMIARVRPAATARFIAGFARGAGAIAADTLRLGPGPTFGPLRLAHDGRRMVIGGFQIDIIDLDRHVVTPLIARTADLTLFQFAQWSPGD